MVESPILRRRYLSFVEAANEVITAEPSEVKDSQDAAL